MRRARGDRWLRDGATAVLLVRSVLVPGPQNVLINPQHVNAASIVYIAAFSMPARCKAARRGVVRGLWDGGCERRWRPWLQNLLAPVTNPELKPPTIEGHEHAAKILPSDFAPIDDGERHTAILVLVSLDAAARDHAGDGHTSP